MDQIKRMRDVVRVYDHLYDAINHDSNSDIAAERLISKICYRHNTNMIAVVRIIAKAKGTNEPPDNIISTIYNTFRDNEKENES